MLFRSPSARDSSRSEGDRPEIPVICACGSHQSRHLRSDGSAPASAKVNAHGTSTHRNDLGETIAFKKVFGEHAYELSISSNKSMIGHLLGAAGGVEAIATALTIENNIVPPTINYQDKDLDDPEGVLDLDYTPNVARERVVNVALSDNLGFGGHNAAIVLKKYVD